MLLASTPSQMEHGTNSALPNEARGESLSAIRAGNCYVRLTQDKKKSFFSDVPRAARVLRLGHGRE
jgi:hypothetical protein